MIAVIPVISVLPVILVIEVIASDTSDASAVLLVTPVMPVIKMTPKTVSQCQLVTSGYSYEVKLVRGCGLELQWSSNWSPPEMM